MNWKIIITMILRRNRKWAQSIEKAAPSVLDGTALDRLSYIVFLEIWKFPQKNYLVFLRRCDLFFNFLELEHLKNERSVIESDFMVFSCPNPVIEIYFNSTWLAFVACVARNVSTLYMVHGQSIHWLGSQNRFICLCRLVSCWLISLC